MPARVLLFILALLSLVLFVGAGCRRKSDQPQVVLYVSADEHIARQVIDRFEKQTGISVEVVGDTEAKKTTGLVERLRSEKDNPQADVFWSSEIFQTIALAEEGVLEEHLSDATKDWPREWRDGQRRWFAFAARPRVIVFSPERVPEDQRPDSWMDLTFDRWKGRIAMADPRFGTTGGHLGAMMSFWDREVTPGYFGAWALGIAENDVRLSSNGNAGVVELVARGEADVGMTDADDVWAAKERGLNVELIYPSHGIPDDQGTSAQGIGTLLIPNTVARVKGGPNPDHTKALIDFLLSEETERMLAESVSHNVPLRPGLAESYPQYAVPDPLRVDWKRAAATREQAINVFLKSIEQARRDREIAAEIEAAATEPEATGDDDDEGG
jgi:iron(III) transport system substrate-binding protein